MKAGFRLVSINLLLCLSTLSTATTTDYPGYPQATSGQENSMAGIPKLVEYMLNLGGYLGYDLKKEPPAPADSKTQFSRDLIDKDKVQLAQYYLLNTVLGAIPVNTFSKALSQFLPNNFPDGTLINNYANASFSKPAYDSTQQGAVSINPLIDQKIYQKDPVSQAVLNILGTPDYSVCLDVNGKWKSDCDALYQNKVMSQVIGAPPNFDELYNFDKYNKQFISQLNINSLLSPLLYSYETISEGESNPNSDSRDKGLTAQSQAEQAANFIRYASGSVAPITQANREEYRKISNKAMDTTQPIDVQMSAQNMLFSYFANLRVFAAQSSVGVGNLYYILSKRMPQNQGSDVSKTTSQALSEFQMATRRLKPADPNNQNEATWVDRINNASSATVQKEIAILLSEINYQMYLNRQQEERMLLTQTMMLIQNTKAAQPSPPSESAGPTPR